MILLKVMLDGMFLVCHIMGVCQIDAFLFHICSEIKEVRKKKERAKELEGIDTSNIVSSTRRRSTTSFVAPPKPKMPVENDGENTDDDDDDDDDDHDDDDHDDDDDNGNSEDNQSEESNAGKFLIIFN